MSTQPAARPRLHRLVERLGEVAALDGPAEAVAKWARGAIPKGPVKDALSGVPIGHAAHPLMIVVPIGTWSSATLLDFVGGQQSRPAARRLIAAGLLASLPTAASGLNDWSDTTPASDSVRRVGAVHALANVAALGLFGASLAARRAGSHGRGVALSLAGMGAVTVGGHLGGHLSYAEGVGVDNTVFASGPEEWTAVLDDAALLEGELRGVEVEGRAIVLARRNGRIHALDDRCAHRSGSLADGELKGECVVCPLHASEFRLEDGAVERGPSAYPQPVFDVRVTDGWIEVKA
ncbi:Rieske 2Fe-2S domain-containing protein [Solirubrobacter sp. CPCC 204708]|uniref:Rieske 2Fe-2S domain-containing protein n=1 Tax=Solirubrobacter deserti TaxID=2282478 RepID=A0ABT4RJM3_9ACTN|nr:Rieske 2Fe-2S domain-containing protein [Solirubrobacter deserti]MBE2320841.1 Rieske 2Fe-2S domain-containing protein [Solirubrobacter deserti]MDA0138475.1 Rieske 2Fe-2S domain-containing protein [Solirubrobacter deserti]